VGHDVDNFEFASKARSAHALSLPLDYAMRALGEAGMVSKELQAKVRPALCGNLMANNR
jgi:hypothetical protein